MRTASLVVRLLYQEFSQLPPATASRKSHQLFGALKRILTQVDSDELDIEEKDYIISDEVEGDDDYLDKEINDESGSDSEDDVPAPKKMKFSACEVSHEQVEEAVRYYKSTKNKKRRSVDSMKSRFRFLKTDWDFRIMLDFEKHQSILLLPLFR